MKKLLLYTMLSVTLFSCNSYRQVDSIKLLYNQRINPDINYKQLSVATGSSKRVIKKSQAMVIDSAINQLIRLVPGGCYIANAKVYVVKGHYLAVSGDVWGIKPTETVQNNIPLHDLNSFSIAATNH